MRFFSLSFFVLAIKKVDDEHPEWLAATTQEGDGGEARASAENDADKAPEDIVPEELHDYRIS